MKSLLVLLVYGVVFSLACGFVIHVIIVHILFYNLRHLYG